MRALLAAGVAGAVGVLAFAPFGWFPLGLLSLAGLYVLLARVPRARGGFALGLAWGLGSFLGGVSWLFVALHRYGGMPAPLAALAILAFCLYLALYPALAGAFFVRWRSARAGWNALLFGALWCLQEWLRGWVFTGFPWLAMGYSQTPPSPLAGLFPLIGVFGVGGVLALLAGWLSEALAPADAAGTGRRVVRGAGLIAVAVAAWGAGQVSWVHPQGAPLDVHLLQTNVAQDEKWNAALLGRWLALNRDLVRQYPGALVVLPETTIPLFYGSLPEGYAESLADPLLPYRGTLVMGTFLRDAEGGIHNAAVTLGEAGGQRYAKHHLVPFGEYSPPLFGWLFRWLRIPMSDQVPGARHQPPLQINGVKVAVNICYEDVFGEELIGSLPDAGVMLNLSNLAWYGDSFAQPQHLQISRVRALETGRPMLRSTNTGMTALVLPDGKVTAALPAFKRDALRVQVRAYTGMTLFGRFGNHPAVALALLVVAGLVSVRRRLS